MESTSSSERTIALVLEYDGVGLSGWQRQENAPSVQEHLEAALSELCQKPMSVTGASRTDAGVHALGQVVSFRTDRAQIPLHGFRRGLNSALPEGISVVSAREVASDFHARFSARGKLYRYLLWRRAERSPLMRHRAWHVPRPLNLPAMREASEVLIGEHDFSAFRAAGCSARHAVREVTSITIATDPQEQNLLSVEVRGNAFLRNMVRIIVGTLVDVGEGRLEVADVGAALRSKKREQAGRTAPAHGLYLVEVFYENSVEPETD